MRNILPVMVMIVMLASCAQRNRQVLMGTIEDMNGIGEYGKIERVLDYKISGNTLETSEFTIAVDGRPNGSWWNSDEGAVITIKLKSGQVFDNCIGHISTDFNYINISCKIGDRVKHIKAGSFSFEVFSGW